jgi:hypothetical protein
MFKEKEIILNYIIKMKGRVSFVEVERELTKNNINPNGDYYIPFKQYKNVYIWVNMSEGFSKSIISLLKDYKICLKECLEIIYITDGKMIDLPIARGKERDYKKEHWLPMVINIDKL